MKTGLILDIIFGALMLPGMMFLFPVAEWLQWHPGYVLAYGIWLYAVWLLCRRFLLQTDLFVLLHNDHEGYHSDHQKNKLRDKGPEVRIKAQSVADFRRGSAGSGSCVRDPQKPRGLGQHELKIIKHAAFHQFLDTGTQETDGH